MYSKLYIAHIGTLSGNNMMAPLILLTSGKYYFNSIPQNFPWGGKQGAALIFDVCEYR